MAFFFHGWTGYSCSTAGPGEGGRVLGGRQRGPRKQRFCVNKWCLLPTIFDLCVCVNPVYGSLSGHPHGSKHLPGNVITWIISGVEQLIQGDVGRMTKAKVNRQAARLAGCVVRASCLPRSTVSSHCPSPPGWTSHLSAQEQEKREKSKTHCPSCDGCKRPGDLGRAWTWGSGRNDAGLSLAIHQGGTWGLHLISKPPFTHL